MDSNDELERAKREAVTTAIASERNTNAIQQLQRQMDQMASDFRKDLDQEKKEREAADAENSTSIKYINRTAVGFLITALGTVLFLYIVLRAGQP